MTREIPLFPLNTVLFPGSWLPLRVFEPRYKQMLAACLDADRAFGIALIKFGDEVGGPATPFRVGTLATIEEVAEEGEVYYLLVRGDRRFDIEAVLEDRAYPRGRVRFLPPVAVSPADDAAARDIRAVHQIYVKTLGRVARVMGQPWPPELVAPIPKGDAAVTANWVAMGLSVPPTEKQRLLEMEKAADMLALERELLSAQLEKWEGVLRRPTRE